MDYKSAGVDIEKGNRIVKKIKEMITNLPSKNIISSIGSFGALVELKDFGCDLVLSSSTDGVGTKLLVAQKAGIHDTVGVDLVAMNVNDIITTGTEPLFFLDYISYSYIDDWVLEDILKGIVKGLELSYCELVGGETAQMPDMYSRGAYDLAGFCIGIGLRNDILPKGLSNGMTLVGFSSSGFHSNGYSLLRKVFFDNLKFDLDREYCGKTLGEILLEPTRIYVSLFKKIKGYINALVHITGGGFYDNIPRVLNGQFDAIVEKSKLPEVEIFEEFKKIGNVEEGEMFRTFNMGIGMIAICEERNKHVLKTLALDEGISAYEIGYIENGSGVVRIV